MRSPTHQKCSHHYYAITTPWSVAENAEVTKTRSKLFQRFVYAAMALTKEAVIEVVFHGTGMDNAPPICREGLDPSRRRRDLMQDFFGDVNTANSYSQQRRRQHDQNAVMVMFLVITNAPGVNKQGVVTTCMKAEYELPIAYVYHNRPSWSM
eukprot:1194768-Prorocentrum_minimum.AAC.2